LASLHIGDIQSLLFSFDKSGRQDVSGVEYAPSPVHPTHAFLLDCGVLAFSRREALLSFFSQYARFLVRPGSPSLALPKVASLLFVDEFWIRKRLVLFHMGTETYPAMNCRPSAFSECSCHSLRLLTISLSSILSSLVRGFSTGFLPFLISGFSRAFPRTPKKKLSLL